MTFLSGLRVLDLSRVLAGPLATQILGDLGAEILKIESPTGDDTRAWGPPFQGEMSAYFQSANRNKASLILDLKREQDRHRLDRLVACAHVVIDNFPPKTRQKLGVTATQLHAKNSQLVCMSITGYRGSRVNEPGYDIMVQAESGLMGITGPAQGEPFKLGVAIVDVLTGTMAANAILAALYRKLQKGLGASLEISLYQTALFSLVNVASNHLVSGEASKRWGNAHANIVPYQDFQLADRRIILGAGNDRQFQKLCDLLAIQPDSLPAQSNTARVANRKLVIEELQLRLATKQASKFIPVLRQAGIPCAPILRPDEALKQVHGWDPGAILAIEHTDLGSQALIAPPFSGDGIRRQHTPAPLLGEGGEALAKQWLTSSNPT